MRTPTTWKPGPNVSYLLVPALALGLVASAPAQEQGRLSALVDESNQLAIAIQPAFHQRYGCLYPMTYRIRVPDGSTGLTVERRRSSLEPWEALPEKTPADLFNGVEAVRFDDPRRHAHVSAAFAPASDSLFLRITDATGEPASLVYEGLDTYYDDRRAVVTVSADDWGDSTDPWFCSALSVFRSRGLYVTGGVMTGPARCSAATWAHIQAELDSGYVEVASHSRSHSGTPYADPVSEVEGSAEDIVSHLRLPASFSSEGLQYVYVWIAPYGAYDATVDSLLGIGGYLVPRLYSPGSRTFSRWDSRRGHFGPSQATLEIGAPGWGGGSTDTSFMNEVFDDVVAERGVYHLMWHPQVIAGDLDQPYFLSHLDHIRGRPDLWYANLGHVYLYRLIEEANRPEGAAVEPSGTPGSFALGPSYPNPFARRTTLAFDVAERALVRVRIFDVQGRQVATLAGGQREPGRYKLSWDAAGLREGVYFCRLEASATAGKGRTFTSTRKLILLD